ncbi:MAG: hypothetical protein AABY22_25545, partial [Nanoarchaeota archaeon]
MPTPAKAMDRDFRQTVQVKWRLEARELGVPICETCAREDYKKGEFEKNIEKYIIKSKPEKIAAIYDMKDSSKQIGEFKEFHCSKGHGNSFEIIYPKKTIEIATIQLA